MFKNKLVIYIKKIIQTKQKNWAFYGYIFILLSMSSFEAQTKTPITLQFEPYEATYRIYWYGFEVGSSVHRLKKLDSRQYLATALTTPLLKFIPFHSTERSQFTILHHQIYPTNYEYQTQEKNKHKSGVLFFDWQKKRIKDQKANHSSTSIPLPNLAQDKITLFFQMRIDLRLKKKNFNYTVIEEKGIKHYSFTITGKEFLKTPFGVFETLRLEHLSDNQERLTKVWVAKDLDYLMIRLQQFKNGRLTAESRIKNLKH